jgi:hypothetical protein
VSRKNNFFPALFHKSPRAEASYDDFSNASTPQNRDSYESAAVGRSQLLFEPVAIRLKGFQRNL